MTRVPLWDNARFAIIVLVVMGHGIQRQIYDSDNALALYLFVYAFHMPALMILSGYFSRAEPLDGSRMKRIVSELIVPYLIFQGIWSLVQFLVEGSEGFNPTQPKWTLWFLVTLAIFRVALPYLALLRWPMLWAVIGAIGVGYWSNVDSTFSLSRTIGILPFFLLGWYLASSGLADRWLAAPARTVVIARLAAVGVFAAWLAVVLANITAFREFELRLWFFFDDSYRDLAFTQWWAGLVRLGIILLALVLCAAFLALVPRRGTIFTGFGQATLYVYLLHSFVLYPIRQSGILRDDHSSAVWLLTMVFASIAISIVLSSDWVRRIFRPLVQPRAAWLFRERDPARPRAAATHDASR